MNLEYIKKLRVERGESQHALAHLLGLKTASAYCKKETGRVPFKVNELNTLAKHYDVAIEKLCSNEIC